MEMNQSLSPTKWYQSPRLDQGKKNSILDAIRIRKEKIAKGILIDSFRRLRLKRMKRSRCYACKIKGHAYWNCPLIKDKVIDDEKGKTVIDGDQHNDWERYVESYNKEVQIYGDYLVQGTDGSNWNKIWYVSKFYSKHMTSNRNLFRRFKACFDVETQKHNTKFLISNGVGEIVLKTFESSHVIPCVSYIPEIGINLLSMKQLIKQVFEVKLDGTTCIIKYMFGDEESTTEKFEKHKLRDCLNGETLQMEEVEFITNYCDILLKNDLKIVKDDDLVEKIQDNMYVEMDDVYKGWYEKKFKEICEKYEFAKKGPMCPREFTIKGVQVVDQEGGNMVAPTKFDNQDSIVDIT